ncbi:MAG: helix-turn-helix domain-containing protein [Aeromicrobium sp.]
MTRAAAIDTALLPAPDRVDFWRSSVCDSFVPLAVEPREGPLRGRLDGGDVAETRLRRIRATSHSFARRADAIRRGDPEVLHLLRLDHGRADVEQDGRVASLEPGDLVLYDSSRPFQAQTRSDFQFTVCLLPKRLLPVSETVQKDRTARPLDARTGVGAATTTLLTSLSQIATETTPTQELALQHAMASMYVALMADDDQTAHPGSVHLSLAKSFVARHLGDPALSPSDVAQACSISLSHLHRLFADDERTVAGHIREQRLQGAYRDLTSGPSTEPVGDIGRRWGLPDPAHFTRAFKRRFGMTPGELRHSR